MASTYRIVVLGAGGVGKTAILRSSIKKDFPLSYVRTVEETYTTTRQFDNCLIKLDILDTDGEGDSTTKSMYYKHGEGFILVYDITDQESFLQIKKIYQEIRAARAMDSSMRLPIVIAGNKCDLTQRRVVQMGEGEELARLLRVDLIETSAKYATNLDELFTLIISEIRNQGTITLERGKKSSACSLI